MGLAPCCICGGVMADYILYEFEGRNIKIPKEYLQRNMRALGLSQEQAIELYLSDEGYVVDPIVQELTEKAAMAGVGPRGAAKLHQRKAPVRRPVYEKRAIINLLADALNAADALSVIQEDGVTEFKTGRPRQVEITNKERIIFFALGEDHYEIMLTKKRKEKN